ncbi:uncharacterized protein [Argopecten irradians]|uniref:uncharacterized protein n=1 Tax=Argopecten irradians TaxID=31199 RepID=UPI00371B69A4
MRCTCILDTIDEIYAQKKEPEVMGTRLAVTKKKVVATILLLCDILKPVNVLSLYLQNENINSTSLPQHVENTKQQLHDLISSYQEYDMSNLEKSQTEFSKCSQIFQEIDDRAYLRRRMRRETGITTENFLRETGIPLIYSFVQEVEDAFCTGDLALTAFGFLNPQNLPKTVSELGAYDKVFCTFHVENTKQQLHDLISSYQEYDMSNLEKSQTEFSKCSQIFQEIDDRAYLRRRMRRETGITTENFLRETGIPLIYSFVQEVEDAFCTGDLVLTAFGFLNPQNLPKTVSELGAYDKVFCTFVNSNHP